GGGIAPDVTVPLPRLNEFQARLLSRDVFFQYEQGVGGFTRWFMGRKPEISRDFRVTDEVVNQFRKYLDRQGIRYTEPEIAENQAWIQRKIRKEVFTSEFGVTDGFRVELEEDPQVQKAIEVLPQARALYQNAKKVIAQRTGAQPRQ
ncbi:MAG: S41 family peptidase, partial [Acidobacteria bacterium]|nr:S41 family peptidase [Acidobacteriota bacterium]